MSDASDKDAIDQVLVSVNDLITKTEQMGSWLGQLYEWIQTTDRERTDQLTRILAELGQLNAATAALNVTRTDTETAAVLPNITRSLERIEQALANTPASSSQTAGTVDLTAQFDRIAMMVEQIAQRVETAVERQPTGVFAPPSTETPSETPAVSGQQARDALVAEVKSLAANVEVRLIDIVALSGRHDARLAEVAAAVARLGDLDPAIRAAVTTGDRLEERLDALQTAVTAALGERLDSLAAHVTAAADAVSSAAGSITSLNNTVARLDSAVAGIRPAGVEGELAALNDRLTELGQSIHGIRAEVDGLRNLARHTGDIVETRTAVSRILSAVGNTPSAHSSAPANGE